MCIQQKYTVRPAKSINLLSIRYTFSWVDTISHVRSSLSHKLPRTRRATVKLQSQRNERQTARSCATPSRERGVRRVRCRLQWKLWETVMPCGSHGHFYGITSARTIRIIKRRWWIITNVPQRDRLPSSLCPGANKLPCIKRLLVRATSAWYSSRPRATKTKAIFERWFWAVAKTGRKTWQNPRWLVVKTTKSRELNRVWNCLYFIKVEGVKGIRPRYIPHCRHRDRFRYWRREIRGKREPPVRTEDTAGRQRGKRTSNTVVENREGEVRVFSWINNERSSCREEKACARDYAHKVEEPLAFEGVAGPLCR